MGSLTADRPFIMDGVLHIIRYAKPHHHLIVRLDGPNETVVGKFVFFQQGDAIDYWPQEGWEVVAEQSDCRRQVLGTVSLQAPAKLKTPNIHGVLEPALSS